MEELDRSPDTSFEQDVVCKDDEAFCLSEDNIAALQNLLQQVCWHTQAALPGATWGAVEAVGGPGQELALPCEERLLGSQQGCALEHPCGSFCQEILEDERVALLGAAEHRASSCPSGPGWAGADPLPSLP